MQTNLVEYLENGALKICPDKEAISDQDKSFTFKELEHHSKNLAHLLINENYKKASPVAVFLPKSAEVIISDLAILYSGNIYTNVDYQSPPERLKALFFNIAPSIVISDKKGVEILNNLNFSAPFKVIEIDSIIALSSDKLYNQKVIDNILSERIDTDPSCIINTSGSTGVPKSVVMSHRNNIDFIDWCIETFEFDENHIMGSLTPPYFDHFTFEFFTSLATGSTISIIPDKVAVFPKLLVDYLINNNITFIFWVPSIMVNISNLNLLDQNKLSELKIIFFAGEIFPTKHLNYWRKYLPNTQFVNLYGPTEIAVDCTYFIVNRTFKDDEAVPIGFPCKNTDILIINDKNMLVSGSEKGELCVRGSSLSLGYYNNPDQTEKSYVQNPLNQHYPEKIYKTGDIVFKNKRNEIVYLGRKDSQIKHMGYRIELSEIEAAILSLPEINNACVLYNQKNKEITLIYESEIEIKLSHIRVKTSSTLPKYMLPTKIHKLNLLPKNKNGKIDRKELTRIYIN